MSGMAKNVGEACFHFTGEERWDWLADRKWLRVMDERGRAALQAVHLAVGASADPWQWQGEQTGLVVTVGDVDWSAGVAASDVGDWEDASPLWLLGVLPNGLAGHVARAQDLHGITWTTSNEASADLLIRSWLQEGVVERCLAVSVSGRDEPPWAICRLWEWA